MQAGVAGNQLTQEAPMRVVETAGVVLLLHTYQAGGGGVSCRSKGWTSTDVKLDTQEAGAKVED